MRAYNRYIVSLGVILLLTTVLLSVWGQTRLDLYFSIYLLESLILTTLFIHLAPRARKGLEMLGYVLFAGFLVIVTLKVVEMLFG